MLPARPAVGVVDVVHGAVQAAVGLQGDGAAVGDHDVELGILRERGLGHAARVLEGACQRGRDLVQELHRGEAAALDDPGDPVAAALDLIEEPRVREDAREALLIALADALPEQQSDGLLGLLATLVDAQLEGPLLAVDDDLLHGRIRCQQCTLPQQGRVCIEP